MSWSPEDIVHDLHDRMEIRYLYQLVGNDGHPRPRYASWTVAEVRAYVANRMGERQRATSHDTGAEPS